ncbi:MupA/Atu3671 family FMN-dependent luciferase-like monooxygenase [Actinophytocola oryzae]|uniref:Natural product biosynthesis luciferase-like monooxygenase protein n=1 Tax=Actinophytocola oryzae TaxID=502181 RepID=A0A4R7W4H2_9PSEU|nr:MupA/Atu3671 family FMN-dependent luciferase-like monooxygenase [Actinophytocola oryzae]TDV57596.1 natural product biosynthesis luciferase-like monooxygenase protein [Actinophytocola oryzae]
MTETTNPETDADTVAERRELLAARLRDRVYGRTYPLSYPQQRLWFLDQLDPGNPVYVVPLVYRIHGSLDVAALEHALNGVVRRHQVLRTVFPAVGGLPRQAVRPVPEITVPVHDVSTEDDVREAAGRVCAEQARTPFDLTEDLMIRPVVVRLAADEHWLCLTLHHMACDAWSLAVLGRELSTLYRAYRGEGGTLPSLPIQYTEYAAKQEELLSGPDVADSLAYWRERLAGVPALATLPADFPRPPTQSYRGAHVTTLVPAETSAAVEALARDSGATPFAVLLAAFAVFVHGYTGEGEVVVGSPVSGRSSEAVLAMIGFCTNTVVQRLDLSGNPTFRELVAAARDESRAAIANQDLPFERLVEELHPNRDPAHNPLFQLMFSYHDGDHGGLSLPDCEVEVVPGDTATAKFDVTLGVSRTGDTLSLRLEYATDLFTAGTAARMVEHFRTALTAAVADPDLTVGAIPLLGEEELARTVAAAPAVPMPDALVHELVAAAAARTPDAPALVGAWESPDEAITYRELLDRAEVLADRLLAHGVGPDTPVGVYLDRGPDLVVALLGTMLAGGAYLPLDPGYPRARLAFMVDDSRAPVVVTSAPLTHRARRLPATLIHVDDPGTRTGAPRPTLSPDNLAYVNYTSGSTGKPKGVMVSHRAVANFFAGVDAVAEGDAPQTWLAVTSVSFDISVLELLWTLSRGHRVVVRGDEPTVSTSGGMAVPAAAQARHMDFSMFYFGGDQGGDPAEKYRLLMAGAKFADRNGFRAVWTPERHFHEFGGLYPNPSVTGAAIAAATERVEVRAGSVVLPLHDPLRVAEEWSVVDNISGGRVGMSIASGWQPNDFVLAPDVYADRKELMLRQIEELRHLWRGGSVTRRNGVGADTEVRIFPRPVSEDLPIWVTSARNPETFKAAAELGAGLLTHLLGHSIEQLADKVALYRKTWQEKGHPGDGQVTVMVHTFVGQDTDAVRELVRKPLSGYIKSSFDLLSGLGQAMGEESDPRKLPEPELDALVARAFDRFFETSALLGTPEHCADVIDQLKAIGVDEVACLVDFGVGHDDVISAFDQLRIVERISADRQRRALADEPIPVQLDRHAVTHLQCTPSVAGLLVDEPEALLGLNTLLVGGEALPEPLAAQLSERVPAVHNMYGPTEATVWATTSRVDGPVAIGKPMTNVRTYVVDTHFRPTPPGAPGELLIGGLGITRGYHGRPGLTATRFVPDPFSGEPGARLYRTGDLVRRDANGTLWFLGRLDHQVKIHGHRIELGEIENTVRAHPALRDAVCAVRGSGAQARIVAYGVPADAEPTAADLRAFCAETLPDYMVPADVVLLSALPTTPNGKVARDELPDPADRPVAEYQPPGNDLEREVAKILAEIVKVERVGVLDNFFDIGGNSLLAVQARGRLQPVLGEGLSLVDIFRYPTVRGLVAAIGGGESGGGAERARESAGKRAAALAKRRQERSRA